MNGEPNYQSEYEEIDLMDYVKVLLKRKGFIFGICLITALVAGVFSLFQPKVYKIETILEIGMIGGGPVKTANQAVGEIKSDIYRIPVQEKLNISELEFPNIKSTNPTNTNLVKLEIESSDTQKAKNILREMANLILKDQQENIENKEAFLGKEIGFLGDNLEIQKKDIERVGVKIGILEEEKKNLEDKEKALEQLSPYQKIDQQLSGSLFTLLDIREKLSKKSQEINDLYLQKNSLEIQISSLKSQINSLEEQINNVKPAQVIKPSAVSENSIKPRPLLNVMIAVVLGLFMGVFLAFFKEWWDKAKIKD